MLERAARARLGPSSQRHSAPRTCASRNAARLSAPPAQGGELVDSPPEGVVHGAARDAQPPGGLSLREPVYLCQAHDLPLQRGQAPKGLYQCPEPLPVAEPLDAVQPGRGWLVQFVREVAGLRPLRARPRRVQSEAVDGPEEASSHGVLRPRPRRAPIDADGGLLHEVECGVVVWHEGPRVAEEGQPSPLLAGHALDERPQPAVVGRGPRPRLGRRRWRFVGRVEGRPCRRRRARFVRSHAFAPRAAIELQRVTSSRSRSTDGATK